MTVNEHLEAILQQVRAAHGNDIEAKLSSANEAMRATHKTWKAISEVRTACIVSLYYEAGMGQEDIAGIIDVSRQRVEQILDKQTTEQV